MSETARQLFDSLKGIAEAAQSIAPGLKNLGPEAAAELSRLGTQGSMELASALFNGNGFVPYGPGQYTPSVEYGRDTAEKPSISGEHSHEAQSLEEPGRDGWGLERG